MPIVTMMCRHSQASQALIAVAGLVASISTALGGPVTTSWPVDGPDDTVCSAAAPMGGWYATADAFEDRIEVRDVRGMLRRSLSRSDLIALAPWMTLDGGPDGPSALAFSASGRLLYILVHDAAAAGDGLPSDVLLRYDISTGSLSRQARLEVFDRGDIAPHLGMTHAKGVVYVGTGGVSGGNGQIVIYPANAFIGGGSPSATWTLPGVGPVHGLTIDRETNTLYAANDTGIYRTAIPASLSTVPTFTLLSSRTDIRGLAWGDHFGSTAQRGLYILRFAGGVSSVEFISAAVSGIGSNLTPSAYTSSPTEWHSISSTSDGRMLLGADEDAVMLSDDSDARLGFDAWARDELSQVVAFGRGLISPDGEPAGWVIDADTEPAIARFHPATPDGAAWTVLLLLMSDEINNDPNAQAQVRQILLRYAGFAADGIKPVRSADGIFKHWINPATGNTESGWPDEYATLSTMKIVLAAARAMQYYPDDPVIVRAASRIIFGTKNINAYFHPTSRAIAFKGLAAGGPDTTSFSNPFQEGITFAEQAGAYGGTTGSAIAAYWFNWSVLPKATYLTGRPMAATANNSFDPAFLSLYAALTSQPYRASSAWNTQVDNIRWSMAAWTDDNATRFTTVFSAGTSPIGYNADTLANRPGNISTFPSLMALAAFGETADAVGAYAAYRKGARQTFRTGASILYRRSTDAGSTFVPNSAGLPDVALGALGLCEIIQPGSIASVLAKPYPTREMCPVDLNFDGQIDVEDLYLQVTTPQDLNGDGATNVFDQQCLINWLRRNDSAR